MKTQLAIAALLVVFANALPAAPLAFSEVSLLVRMRESDAYITQQLAQRRLLRALTPEQEAKLKAEGCSDRLLQALRDPAHLMLAADATAFENWSAEQQHAIAEKMATQAAEEEAHRVAQAEQAAAEAAWMRQQQEIIAREKARAEAAVAAADNYATSYPDYYGSYGGYGGGYGYGGYPIAPGRPTHPIYSGGKVPSGGALIWGNGTSTAPNSPGLNYYPLGSNGSNVTPGPAPGSFSGASGSGGRSSAIGHGSSGSHGGGGGRGGASGPSGGTSGRGGGGGSGSIGGAGMGGMMGGRGGR